MRGVRRFGVAIEGNDMASPVMVTVLGSLDQQPNEDDPSATITFVRKFWAGGPDGTTLEPGSQSVTVAADGSFSVEIASNNDPDWYYFGTDILYEIVIKTSLDGTGVTYRYKAVVPYDTPGGSMFLPIAVTGTVEAPDVWAPVNHTHPELGGGGGGGVVSVNTKTGVVVLVASDIGAAASVHTHAYDPSGTASAAISAHVGASDPHTQYALESDVSTTLSGYATISALTTGLSGKANTAHSHAQSDVTSLVSDLAAKASLASPAFTGTPSLPTGTTGITQTAGNSSTALATTAFATTADNLRAPLASPTLTGTPAAPTATAGTNTTQIATTAFVTAADVAERSAVATLTNKTISQSQITNLTTDLAAKAPLASPALTGVPTAPTATGGTNTTQVATTAFVAAAVGGGGGTAATFARGYITTGDLTMVTDAGWVVQSGTAFSIAAVVGDDIEATVNCLLNTGGAGADYFDLVVVVGGAIVRAASSGTATPAVEGDPAMYPDVDVVFRGTHSSLAFSAVSGDISGGTVTFALAHKGPGGGTPKIYASTAYPFRWSARNDH